ncbi:hypothetical protein AAE02nite_10450 [Adhaeribacter aerolatus]|uniref:CBM6 domain-containing protein n=1 Tax=Adhaeribacter aerolatus TaxID=670289 RepID=A0A512AUJ5_9BACT|nr:hypothetical protein [Adhaeribacter aerolatus]GEO03381.1 hypothetical protein AAE02nite_10450 [Adhaeribacter aerolatus]
MTIIFSKDSQKDKKWAASFFLYKRQLAFFVLTFLLSQLFPSRVFSYPQDKQTSTLATEQSTTWEAVIGNVLIYRPGYGIKKIELKTTDSPEPELVVPEKDGTLRLLAEKGRGLGPKIKYMPEWKAYGWFTADDQVEWEVQVKKGSYDVYLEWSVSDQEAGKPFVFKVGDQTLTGTVEPSGSWEDFKTVKIGHLKLRSGRQKMVFKPNSKFDTGAILDLREIKLVPAKPTNP